MKNNFQKKFKIKKKSKIMKIILEVKIKNDSFMKENLIYQIKKWSSCHIIVVFQVIVIQLMRNLFNLEYLN